MSGLSKAIFPEKRINTHIIEHGFPKFPELKSIPKKIHQAFIGKIPDAILRNCMELKSTNADYQYNFYDNDAIIKFISQNYGSTVLNLYFKINKQYPAAQVDLFRYLVIYKEGGIYLDVKSAFSKPLQYIIKKEDKLILCSWDNRVGEAHNGYGHHAEVSSFEEGEYQQWHIISIPGHPLIRDVINLVLTNIGYYRPWLDGIGQFGVLRTTGPIPYTLAIREKIQLYPHRYFRTHVEFGLQYSTLGTSIAHINLIRNDYRQKAETIVIFDCFHLKLLSSIFSMSILFKRIIGLKFQLLLKAR